MSLGTTIEIVGRFYIMLFAIETLNYKKPIGKAKLRGKLEKKEDRRTALCLQLFSFLLGAGTH